MSEGNWLDETIPVDLLFYKDDKGRKVLIADEDTLAGFREIVDTQKRLWEDAKETIAARHIGVEAIGSPQLIADSQQLAQLERLLREAEDKIAALEEEHAGRMVEPIVETYHILPYSYFDRMEAEDRFTTIDKETQESQRKEDRIRDALLVQCVKGVTRKKTEQGHENESETVILAPAQVRRFSSPIATRLWFHVKERSEPSEAETFRARLGLG